MNYTLPNNWLCQPIGTLDHSILIVGGLLGRLGIVMINNNNSPQVIKGTDNCQVLHHLQTIMHHNQIDHQEILIPAVEQVVGVIMITLTKATVHITNLTVIVINQDQISPVTPTWDIIGTPKVLRTHHLCLKELIVQLQMDSSQINPMGFQAVMIATMKEEIKDIVEVPSIEGIQKRNLIIITHKETAEQVSYHQARQPNRIDFRNLMNALLVH